LSDLPWLAIGWLAYAALHSLLAALGMKAWVARCWPELAPWYRLAYNLLAALLLLPLLWATWTIPGNWLWRWSGAWTWLANGLALAALCGPAGAAQPAPLLDFYGKLYPEWLVQEFGAPSAAGTEVGTMGTLRKGTAAR
jgi:hypothetical protein